MSGRKSRPTLARTITAQANTAARSAAESSRHFPAERSPSAKFPMRTRSRRRVGWPAAAVIRRTWRFLPSTSSRASQASGTFLRKRMGGSRGETAGAGSVVGLDFGSVMAVASAQALDVGLVADLLPEIEPLVIAAHRKEGD